MTTFVQLMIFACSGTVAFCVGSKSNRVRRIGFVAGLIGQPFWFWTAWANGQWAIFMLSFWYAFCYCRGILNLRRISVKEWLDQCDRKSAIDPQKQKAILDAVFTEIE